MIPTIPTKGPNMKVFWAGIAATLVLAASIPVLGQVTNYGARRPKVTRRAPDNITIARAVRDLENKVRRLERRIQNLER